MQILAETMAPCFKKGNEGCFTCGDKNHLKRDCPKKVNKNLQKSALTAVEKCIGPKSVNLNLILKGNLFRGTPTRRPHTPHPSRSPSTKTRGKFHLFPQTLIICQCCCQYTSPKLLYPQEVPSRIPAGLFGPLPPNLQSFIGQSSLT